MNALRNTVRWAGAAVLAALLVSCNSSDSSDEPSGEMASASIGPAGGTVAFADGRLTLVIPPGALASATQITITELTAAQVPAHIATLGADKVYRLEPAGTQFAVLARIVVRVPPSPTGAIALLAHESNGVFEAPTNMKTANTAVDRVVEADVLHFSNEVVKTIPEITIQVAAHPTSEIVGETVRFTATLTNHGAQSMEVGLLPARFNENMHDWTTYIGGFDEFVNGGGGTYQARVLGKCVVVGTGRATVGIAVADVFAVVFARIVRQPVPVGVEISAQSSAECTAPPPPPPSGVVAVGLFNIPGLTAPDGINYFAGPFTDLTGTGPFAAVAGAEGVKVIDLVTQQVVLDRTATGPDGAILGTDVLGVVPVAQAASAGARAAFVSYTTRRHLANNWDPTRGWGGSVGDTEPTFDAVTAGGGLVANSVLLVRPVGGIAVVSFDPTAMVYRLDPARSAPLSAFPAGGQLVSAQMPDAAGGGVLALSRATTAGTSTSSKVFFKNVDDAEPALTLLSWGNVDTRRLRCIPVGGRQACVATLFDGVGRAFLFDPASPRDTPRVTTLVAAAGTLGVALSALPNGRVVVVMANFTANSLTVAELSADLVTVHSLDTIPAPTGCTGTAHPALVTDSEGMKAVVTCNGTNNYWVAKLP